MAGRGTSEVVELRRKLKILEGAVWALVDRVNDLEDRLDQIEKRRRAKKGQPRARQSGEKG